MDRESEGELKYHRRARWRELKVADTAAAALGFVNEAEKKGNVKKRLTLRQYKIGLPISGSEIWGLESWSLCSDWCISEGWDEERFYENCIEADAKQIPHSHDPTEVQPKLDNDLEKTKEEEERLYSLRKAALRLRTQLRTMLKELWEKQRLKHLWTTHLQCK